jgi:uncharacterized protein
MPELVGIAGFARALAAAGLAVASDAAETYTTALRHVDLGNPAQVYWAGRATLCRGPDDIGRYDLVFEHWFGGTVPIRAPQHGQRTRRSRIAALDTTGAAATGGDAPLLRVAADGTEILWPRRV